MHAMRQQKLEDNVNLPTVDNTHEIDTKPVKRNLYDWADSLFHDGTLTATLMHTLKAIISCSDNKGVSHATMEAINKSRERTASKKIVKAGNISLRTVIRHIEKLEELVPEFRVSRYKHGYVARNTYHIDISQLTFEKQRSDIMSPLVVPLISDILNHHPNHHSAERLDDFQNNESRNETMRIDDEYQKHLESKRPKPLPQIQVKKSNKWEVPMDVEQRLLWDKVKPYGVWRGQFINWLKTFSLWQIESALSEARQRINVPNPGAYMAKILARQLSESYTPKVEANSAATEMTNIVMGAFRTTSELNPRSTSVITRGREYIKNTSQEEVDRTICAMSELAPELSGKTLDHLACDLQLLKLFFHELDRYGRLN